MVKVLQSMGHIKRQKKKYGLYTLLLLFIMLSIYFIGILVTGSQRNLFTVIAILLTLAVAQIAVRFFVYLPYKDGDSSIGRNLEQLSENYVIYHSVLVTDGKGNSFFDHLIISSGKTYCISDKKYQNSSDNKRTISRIFERKGMKNRIDYIEGQEKIEKFMNDTKENLHNDTQLQEEMIHVINQYSL